MQTKSNTIFWNNIPYRIPVYTAMKNIVQTLKKTGNVMDGNETHNYSPV